MGQHFTLNDVGKRKDIALKEQARVINTQTGMSALGRLRSGETYNDQFFRAIAVFSCFDNMEARKLLFDLWINAPKAESGIFIDGRQNAENLEVYAVLPENIDRYRETLFDDSEVEDLPCNFRATTHTGFITSALMISIYTNYLTNRYLREPVRTIPFKTSFNIPLMLYEDII